MERRAWLFVAGLTLLGCACRMPLLFHGIWRDEASTYFDVIAPTVAATLREISQSELTPPAFFLLMRGWIGLFGTSEVMLKLPAFVFGAALVPATYALGRQFASRGAAVVAAGFAAFSLTALTLSTEARAYTLCALLGAVALRLALRYLSENAGAGALLRYCAVATTLAYVHYTGVVLVAAFAFGSLTFAARRATRRKLASFEAANAIVFGAFLPWLPHAAGARHAAFLEPRSGMSFAGRFVEQFGFVLPVDFMHVQYGFLFLVAIAALSFRYLRRPLAAKPSDERRVAASLALLAGTLMETGLSLHEQRYMFAFTPLADVLAATLCCALFAPVVAALRRRAPGSPLRTAFAAALCATAVAGAPTQARAFERLYGTDRSGIGRLAGDVLPTLDRSTLVVVAPDYLAPTLGYYLRLRPDLDVVGVPQWASPEHPHCCGEAWRDPHMAAALSARIIATVGHRYTAVAYIYDLGAYDEGAARYSKIFDIRRRLACALKLSEERRYDGSKERVGLALFHARTR